MTSKVRDFNLLKVADVSSNSTTNNNVSVVVNADSSGNSQTSNDNINFTQQGLQTPTPIFPSATLDPTKVVYPSESNQAQHQIQELEYHLNNAQNELRFYQLLSTTLSNILKDNNPRLVINLIDQSGKIIIEAQTLIELIAIKTNSDPNLVNISFIDEEPSCMTKVNPIKNIAKIKIDNETFQLKFNREFNILQDTYNISLSKCIINNGFC